MLSGFFKYLIFCHRAQSLKEPVRLEEYLLELILYTSSGLSPLLASFKLRWRQGQREADVYYHYLHCEASRVPFVTTFLSL